MHSLSSAQAADTLPRIDLGSAENFAVLAGSAITNVGNSYLSGSAGADVGSSPTPAFTGYAGVTTTGTKYLLLDPIVTQAKADLGVAYQDLVSRVPTQNGVAELGGKTLTEGVYNSASSIGLTGTLILDGQNNPDSVFIFQAGSTVITAAASKVQLINGAQVANVFWQVGSSATFGASSLFVGHVLANTTITAGATATFRGQLLANNGAVALDSNTVINDASILAPTPTPTPTPTLTVTPTPTPTPMPTVTQEPTPTPVETSATPMPTETSPEVQETQLPKPSETAPKENPEVIPTEDSEENFDSIPDPDLSHAPTTVPTTDTGGQLPNTDGTDLCLLLIIGLGLFGAGISILLFRRRTN